MPILLCVCQDCREKYDANQYHNCKVKQMVLLSKEQYRDLLIERDGEIRSLKNRIILLENRIQYLLEQKNKGRKTATSIFKFEDIPSIRSRLRRKQFFWRIDLYGQG